MARVSPTQGLMPSLLDRLIDSDTEGTAQRAGYTIDQVIDAVRRDLEELLNAHQSNVDFPEEWVELKRSVYLYGMPDLVSFNATTSANREQLGRLVEAVVTLHEPRLTNVRAILSNAPDPHDRSLRFHIEARVNVDPAPEVAFVTVLELTTGRATIQASETMP